MVVAARAPRTERSLKRGVLEYEKTLQHTRVLRNGLTMKRVFDGTPAEAGFGFIPTRALNTFNTVYSARREGGFFLFSFFFFYFFLLH